MNELGVKRYLWHHRAHETWGDERLFFWRIAFFPTYEQKLIRKELKRLLASHQVRSYALYEIYGTYDLVMRIWLPTRTSAEGFTKAMEDALTPLHLDVCDPFSVGEVLRHWPWSKDGNDLAEIEGQFLTRGYEPDILNQLNEIAAGRLGWDEKDEPLLAALESKVLAPCEAVEGLKFIVVVTSSSQLATIAARRQLRTELRQILSEAEEGGAILDTSLYEGSGFGQFIIMGRVRLQRFSALRTTVVDAINSAGAGTIFRARPYTYVTAGEGSGSGMSPVFEDMIPVTEGSADSAEQVTDYLAAEESEKLEVKGSAFVNVDRWVRSGKAVSDPEVAERGVLRAIVGMLNARGGKLIIGALETKRYDPAELEDRFSRPFPVSGHYVCTGVELDWQGHDWDWFERRLRDMVMTRVNPPPVGLITITRASVEDTLLCVISIQPTDREWFYLMGREGSDVEFLVRSGNSTRELSGPIADGYKQAHRRG
jgi:hypothetical protein